MRRSHHILLVEDNRDDEALMVRALRKIDGVIALTVARDGDEAVRTLDAIATSGRRPDVVFLDLNLPRRSGLAVLEHARADARLVGMPIVLLSSSSRDEDVSAAYARGANAYVQKAVDFERFTSDMQTLAAAWLHMNLTPAAGHAPTTAEGPPSQGASAAGALDVCREELLLERLQESTASLARELQGRERQLDARVKNDLEVVTHLMSLQLQGLTDPLSRDALRACQARVRAISLLHESLATELQEDGAGAFSRYAASLVASVVAASGLAPEAFELDLAIDAGLDLDVAKIVPCALLLNELLTNVLGHEAPPDARTRVRVAVTRLADGRITLHVDRDGIGLGDTRSDRGGALGHKLVAALATQLAGEVAVDAASGSTVGVRFVA